MTTFLTIPAEDEARALSLGAKRDPDSGFYFVPTGAELAPFQPWLPVAATSSTQGESGKGISLTALLSRIGNAITQALPQPAWVRVEISSLERNSHIYLEIVDCDDSGAALSKSRANIWRNQADRIEKKFLEASGNSLAAGMKVLVLVKVRFHKQYGLSLNITDIDPSFTLGDMEARRRSIRKVLEASGKANLNRSLPAPLDFCNVAVISPEDAAGLGDFQVEADRLVSAGLCAFSYFHAIFQGQAAKDSMKNAFIAAHKAHESNPFDALVVIRGGGPASDLHWLNDRMIAEMVCRFHAPVFTGIGHERDETILDEYANRTFGTPSKVIAHIKEAIAVRANKALEDWTSIFQMVHARLSTANSHALQRCDEIITGVNKLLDHGDYRCSTELMEVQNRTSSMTDLAGGKIDAIHSAVLETGRSMLDISGTATAHLFTTIKERSVVAVSVIDVKTKNAFSSVTLASRRSIDGIAEHLGAYWLTILDGTAVAARTLASESEKHIGDVRYQAHRMLVTARQNVIARFHSVTLASRRSIDGIAEFLDVHWLAILDTISVAARTAESDSARHFADVKHHASKLVETAHENASERFHSVFFAAERDLEDGAVGSTRNFDDIVHFSKRAISDADNGARDLINGILAHGVEPTLRRGFAIISSNGKPVATKAAATSHWDLEIMFKDGTLLVTRTEE